MDLNLEIVMCKCGTIINEDTSAVREPFQETHSIDKLFIKQFQVQRLSPRRVQCIIVNSC